MTSRLNIGRGVVRAGALVALAWLSGPACSLRQGMYDQAKYKPYSKSEFFTDLRSSRPPVEGTVARGELREDDLFYRGIENGKVAERMPFRPDKAAIERGRERFDIYCSMCHGKTGRGDGIVVRRGFHAPPSLHEGRLRKVAVGHIFQVITEGFGAMPSYSAQVEPRDRWNIIAYIRALQLSTSATAADVPAGEREKLK